MLKRSLCALAIASWMVVFGPGIGTAGQPGDPAGLWVQALLVVGATARVAAPLLPRPGARRQTAARPQPAPTPQPDAQVVEALAAIRRQQYREGSISSGYSAAHDHAEPVLQPSTEPPVGAHTQVIFM